MPDWKTSLTSETVDENGLAELQERVQAGLAAQQPDAKKFVAQRPPEISIGEQEAFFRKMLCDIDGPTAPFGLLEGTSGIATAEWSVQLNARLSRQVRKNAHRIGVSTESICHLAWAQVLARLSARKDVVFGTVLPDVATGEFTKILPLRVSVGGESALKSLQHTHNLLAELMLHAEASPELARQCSAVPPSTPLFSALVDFRQNVSLGDLEQVLGGDGHLSYPFTLTIRDLDESFRLTVRVDGRFDPVKICAFVITSLESLVAALERAPLTPLRYLNMLQPGEWAQVVHGWNSNEITFPSDRCVHQLVEAQAERSPEATALLFEDEKLSYAELNRRANQLGQYLRELGVRPDDRVALCCKRGFEMVMAMLAVLKAGACYVPLDPAYPSERLRFILEDSAPAALISQNDLRSLLPEGLGFPVLTLNDQAAPWSFYPNANLKPASTALTPGHLAYVIYTSGSTGTPKGVMVEHRSLVNLISWHIEAFDLTPGHRTSSLAGLGFDAAAWEIWPTLCSGATLVLPVSAHTSNPESLLSWWASQDIHISFLPTPIAELALNRGQLNTNLQALLIGGDRLNRVLPSDVPFSVVNNYGPTETTVVATSGRIGPSTPLLSIGRPIANTRVYILDADGEPAPIGVAGELHIGGVGVARGYLNRPELTAERFLTDPFVHDANARMYKTGDLGRWLPDGTIEFLGRNDFQVKIRGFRIELGEIEGRLVQHPGVHEAVVLARQEQSGDNRLIAYVVPNFEAVRLSYTETQKGHIEQQPLPDSDSLHHPQRGKLTQHLTVEVKKFLRERLPEYMVPAAYVCLDAMPLTPNGKLDRKALPAPEADAYAVRAYEAPQGEIESVLAQIWAEVLKLDRVGRHDNFFELGGHSLLAVTLIERMRRNGVHTDVRTLFATPTLAELATATGSAEPEIEIPPNRIPAECTDITPEMLPLIQLKPEQIARIVRAVDGGASNIQDIYPLAPLQEGMLFHHLMAKEGDPYLLSVLMSFDGRARLNDYLAAMQAVIDRHDILRTGVFWEELPEPVQVVLRRAWLPIEEVAFEAEAGDAIEQLYARYDPRHYRMDLHQAPLLRVALGHDHRANRWLLLLLLHHLAGDHTTMDVLQGEIQAHLLGREKELPAALPFRNLVAQTRLGISKEEHETFFREMLKDVDEPTAPFGLLEVQGDGSGIAEAVTKLDLSLCRRLRQNARRLGVSVASLFHVAWAQLLARASARTEVVFGTVLFGRMQGADGADRAMGLFINTLPLRIRISGQTVLSSVRQTHAMLAWLLRHEHASLALAQRCSAVQAPAPLFSALLNYRHSAGIALPPSEELAKALQGIKWIGGDERTNYPFALSVDDIGDGFLLSAQVDASLDPQRICGFMQTTMESLVTALEQSPEMPLGHVEILPANERQQLLHGWNNTASAYPSDKCVHELFEAQVERTPDARALVFEDRKLSYAELNRQANRLAHYLRQIGVRPDDRVALCLDRSIEIIVGLLAVLKAGGAYVPLDPTYPAERLRFMLEDSEPAALLTQSQLLGLFETNSTLTMPVLDLSATTHPWHDQPETDPDLTGVQLTSRNLAYVVYTSGSTGVPKGVMVEHRNAVNYTLGAAARLRLESGMNYAMVSTIATDLGNTVVFPSLLLGGCLHVISQLRAQNGDLLADYFEREAIDVLKIVPPHLAALQAKTSPERILPKRRLILGGDSSRQQWIRDLLATAPRCQIFNHYGPTETTVGVVTYEATSELPHTPSGTLPLGKPLPNSRIYILDAHGELTPIGVPGEVVIGGEGVARGYLNRPDLSGERFAVDHFSDAANQRLYFTGDRARYLPDGNLEFLGRMDRQVKIRGYRVELTEIEEAIRNHSGVREAAVLLREDTIGDQRLTAYIVPKNTDQPLWGTDNLYILPDGSPVAHLNKNETDYIYHEIFVLKAYLRHGITVRDGDCIVDAGANIGLFTVFVNRLARDLRMFSFEPNPTVYECLKANAAAWGENVKCLPFGLSSKNTTSEMTFYEGLSLLSGFHADPEAERNVVKHYVLNQQSASPRTDQLAADIEELIDHRLQNKKFKAELRTLSSVIAQERIDRIDLLKVNVEKSELEVLKGLQPGDWKKIRQLVIEVDLTENLEPIALLLKQHGYHVAVEQDVLLKKTDLHYIYAIRPSAEGQLIPEESSDLQECPLINTAEKTLTPAILQKTIADTLPDYMVPSAYVRLDALPLTANGKLDWRALPTPDGTAYAAYRYELPQGETESLLADIFSEVLHVERVGRHDNFFQLGGHSLLAMQLVTRIQQALQLEVPLADVFTHPVVRELAEHLVTLQLERLDSEDLAGAIRLMELSDGR
jgi:amino acid adenylation domain-containing protein/FkbM family methyltransferase